MKTIKQIADEIGIDKQKVYRYIKKNHINDVHLDAGVMYIDDVIEKLVIEYFCVYEVHHESHQNHINEKENDVLIEMLKKELDSKNEQILNMQKLLDQEQQLRMIVEQKNLLLEEKVNAKVEHESDLEEIEVVEEKPSLWKRFFGNKN